jgi:Na+-driven multidrug efflux pump
MPVLTLFAFLLIGLPAAVFLAAPVNLDSAFLFWGALAAGFPIACYAGLWMRRYDERCARVHRRLHGC